jgi:hypothetical protein
VVELHLVLLIQGYQVAVVAVDRVMPPMDLLVQVDQERRGKDLQVDQEYIRRRWQVVEAVVVAEL